MIALRRFVFMSFSCSILLLFPCASRGVDPNVMRAHFIHVGQGQATLLEFPKGAVLIDTGGQDEYHTDALLDYLRDFFQTRSDLSKTLDLVITSHPHIDHTRGLRAVKENFRVLGYVDNGNLTGSGKENPKWIRANPTGTMIRAVRTNEIHALSDKKGLTDAIIDPLDAPSGSSIDPKIVVLSGGVDADPGWPQGEFEDQNNHSVVVRVDFGDASFLFSGDLEEPAINSLVEYYDGTNMLDTDVWLTGHHGSENATTKELLDSVTPDYAFIGVGRWRFGAGSQNQFTTFRFGHPRKKTIESLEMAIPSDRAQSLVVKVAKGVKDFHYHTIKKRIYATGWEGDIVVTANADGTIFVNSDHADESAPVGPSLVASASKTKTSAAIGTGKKKSLKKKQITATAPETSKLATAIEPPSEHPTALVKEQPAEPLDSIPQQPQAAPSTTGSLTDTYRVLQTTNLIVLEGRVNEAIQQGFHPVGGVIVFTTPDGATLFAQAVVRSIQ